MGEVTAISWCDHTFNPWIGCTEVSVGPKGACVGCYARELAARYGFAQWGDHPRHKTSAANWTKPRTWDRKAKANGTRPFVFCASLADVFDNQVNPAWRADLFDLIRSTPHLTWLLLTKRPQNVVRLYAEVRGDEAWPANAAIGCTVVTQAEADRDIPWLLRSKAALHPAFAFVSMEPLMEHTEIDRYLRRPDGLDWVICGGETDQGRHKARFMEPSWARELLCACAVAGVPFHLKQMTRKAPVPADLQIQERPGRAKNWSLT